MSVNTMVWGFTCQWTKIIEALRDNDLVTPKCWVSRLEHRQDKLLKEKNILKLSDFHSLTWTQKYKNEMTKYNNSVEFNQEVYDKVYEKLYFFIDQYSRHDQKLQQRSVHYYINQFNLLYHFFYGVFVKEKIQLALFDCTPHLGADMIIYEIAKALNINTFIIFQSVIENRLYYLDSLDDFGDFHFMAKPEETQRVKLEKTFFANPSYVRYIQGLRKTRFPFWSVIGRSIVKPHRFFEFFSCNYLRYLRVKRYQKNLATITSSVDYGKKYVYFPLHFQPEATTSTLGGMFCDQVLALELLSKKIPQDWIIYVKENPIQTESMRDDAFFARLKQIPNLRMTPVNENTFKLIEHSQFVVTVTGTAGWEAICGGKPALVFGKAWYQNFEGVFKWNDEIDIHEIAHYQVDHTKLENDYNQHVSKTATGIIERVCSYMVEDYNENENIQNLVGLFTKLIHEMDHEVILA